MNFWHIKTTVKGSDRFKKSWSYYFKCHIFSIASQSAFFVGPLFYRPVTPLSSATATLGMTARGGTI